MMYKLYVPWSQKWMRVNALARAYVYILCASCRERHGSRRSLRLLLLPLLQHTLVSDCQDTIW